MRQVSSKQYTENQKKGLPKISKNPKSSSCLLWSEIRLNCVVVPIGVPLNSLIRAVKTALVAFPAADVQRLMQFNAVVESKMVVDVVVNVVKMSRAVELTVCHFAKA